MSEARTIPAKYVFLDIVGFTNNRSAEAQSHIVEELNRIIETATSGRGIPKENTLFIPVGDGIGIALLNIESPYDIHLSLALDILKGVSKYNAATRDEARQFEVRVGINSNVDNLITDINGNLNIAGAGVNIASRVMQLADGSQILASDPVFDALRYHEKYAGAFKPFRAKIKHGLELPVYQFTAQGREGLNTSTPLAFQDAEKPNVAEQTFYEKASPRNNPAITSQSFYKSLMDTWSPAISENQTDQTQSYLKGILPEPEKKETPTEKLPKTPPAKTETFHFLEEAEAPKQNRSWLWAAAVFTLAGISLGIWFLMRGQGNVNTSEAPAKTISTAPSQTPASSPSVVPSQTPSQEVADTTTTQAPKPNAAFTPKRAAVAETRVKNTPNFVSARPVIQRTVEQRATIERPAPPKKQTVKVEKPKTAKKLTLDDLIN